MADQNKDHQRRMMRSADQAREVMNYSPPAYFTIIRRTMFASVGVAVFSIVYVVFWFYTATGLRGGLEEWATQARQAGWAVNYTQSVLSGFPFAMNLNIKNPEFASAKDTPVWTWKGRDLVVSTRPWNPGKLTLHFPNRHEVKLAEIVYEGTSSTLTSEFRPGKRWPKELLIAAQELVLRDGKGRQIEANFAVFKASYDPTVTTDINSSSLDFELEGQKLVLPPNFKSPLGLRIENISIAGSVMAGIEDGELTSVLSKWRDAGGTLEIPRFSMTYGPLQLIRSDGTLALDGNLQPVGAFTAKVRGFFELLDSLRLLGWINGKDSITAKLTLGALYKRDETGGPPSLNLAISAQDGKIFAGQNKLAEMPHIAWGSKTAPN